MGPLLWANWRRSRIFQQIEAMTKEDLTAEHAEFAEIILDNNQNTPTPT